jgi:hypothetical protein
MIYLKTYFYTLNEVKFLRANLKESYNHIDKFIICESNIHHTGRHRDFIFESENLIDQFDENLRDKIVYLPCDLQAKAVDAYDDENAIHAVNEPLMRSFFMKLMEFNDNDIIFSVDADEIIYEKSYPFLIDMVRKHRCIQINLNQFFYKVNYLWVNKDFWSPCGAYYSHFKNRFPVNWRDEGTQVKGRHGSHFSWCMTPAEMVHKLHTYSHPKYRFCADEAMLKKAIEDKVYPFDKNTSFDIKEINIEDGRIPDSLK